MQIKKHKLTSVLQTIIIAVTFKEFRGRKQAQKHIEVILSRICYKLQQDFTLVNIILLASLKNNKSVSTGNI